MDRAEQLQLLDAFERHLPKVPEAMEQYPVFYWLGPVMSLFTDAQGAGQEELSPFTDLFESMLESGDRVLDNAVDVEFYDCDVTSYPGVARYLGPLASRVLARQYDGRTKPSEVLGPAHPMARLRAHALAARTIVQLADPGIDDVPDLIAAVYFDSDDSELAGRALACLGATADDLPEPLARQVLASLTESGRVWPLDLRPSCPSGAAG